MRKKECLFNSFLKTLISLTIVMSHITFRAIIPILTRVLLSEPHLLQVKEEINLLQFWNLLKWSWVQRIQNWQQSWL